MQSNGTSRLLVYKLGANLPTPVNEPARLTLLQEPPANDASSASVARGEDLYMQNCMRCHGGLVGEGGVVQDLRYISPGSHEIFNQIVLGGIYAPVGMVSFADVLNEDEVDDIHAFVLDAAHDTWAQQHESGWWRDSKLWLYDHLGELAAWILSPE